MLLGSFFSLRAATFEVAQREPAARDDGPGSRAEPWKTVGRAVQQVRAGDTILIRDGVYREQVRIRSHGLPDKPIRLEAAPGAHVVLTGADQISDWKPMGADRPVFTSAWPHRFITWSKHMTHPDDEYHRVIGRCEQVVIENQLLRQVLETNQLAPGTFCVDLTSQLLLAWDAAHRDLNKVSVEASVRQEIIQVEGDYVAIRGIHFRYAANMAQHGAVVLNGKHDLLEDCEIDWMNASGATFAAEDQVVRRCTFRSNGQLGFGANGAHRLLFTDCLVEDNNTKGFDRGWEAGGDKLVLCRDAMIERSRFLRNRGNGIWFDIGNEHCTVAHCLIADNEDAGIFYEISYGLQAHDNVITGNGFASTGGAWGAQAGISLSSSPDCVIERNLIVGNREGFNFREQNRTTPRIESKSEVPVWNHDELIQHNIIAFNRDAQIWGWFDTRDDRHWPGARKEVGAGAVVSSNGNGRPAQRLELEALRLRFEANTFFANPGQGWFNWGTSWGRHTNYSSLGEFQSGLGIDQGGRVLDPVFSNILAHDYRARREAVDTRAYPESPVPGVVLGLEP